MSVSYTHLDVYKRQLMENKSLEQRMETEPVHRVILSLAAPTVLSMLVISA